MTVIIQIVGLASGEPSDAAGLYVQEYTPDGYGGRGDAVLTPRESKAKRYASSVEAMEHWRQVSSTHPVRPGDGRPNRPLTAFTIEIVTVDR
jgi:hypothetical protein